MGTYCRNSPHRHWCTTGHFRLCGHRTCITYSSMFERTGLFLHSVNAWNGSTLAEQTFERFKSHFTRANELRVTALSSADSRYADANAAMSSPPGTQIQPHPHQHITHTGTDTGSVSVSGNRMYYCWSHGLDAIVVVLMRGISLLLRHSNVRAVPTFFLHVRITLNAISDVTTTDEEGQLLIK